MSSCRVDVETALCDMRTVFSTGNTFAVHKAGGKPLITSDRLVAFENLSQQSPIHEMFMAELRRVENTAPGAAAVAGQIITVVLFAALVELDSGRPWISITTDIDANCDRILHHLREINRWPKWEDIVSVASQGLTEVESDLLRATLETAGPSGRVYLEPSHGSGSVVERVIGNTFKLVPCQAIMSDGQWRRDYVKCAVIDGIIESVSEIDRLLMACHETGQPMAIFARGFDNDVLSTLVVNRARGTLDVMAITAPYDLDLINTLNDVAVVCGGDVVSSLKGELISAVKFDDLPVVQSVHCIPSSVTVRNDITRRNVEAHSVRLAQKVHESNIQDIGKLIEDRIRSLTSDYVRVLVAGVTPSARQASIERIDRALRTVRSARAAGVVQWADAVTDASLEHIRHPQELISSLALAAGLQSSSRLASQVLSLLAGS